MQANPGMGKSHAEAGNQGGCLPAGGAEPAEQAPSASVARELIRKARVFMYPLLCPYFLFPAEKALKRGIGEESGEESPVSMLHLLRGF